MFDFSSQISIPVLPYDALSDSRWRSQSSTHIIHDENIDPSIAAVVDSYGASHSRIGHRRQRSCSLSIGVGHPSVLLKPSLQQSHQSTTTCRNARPPLTIRIPNVASLNPIRRRIFNTTRPSSPLPSSSPRSAAAYSMPTLQAVSDWVAASQKRTRNSREQRAKIVANRLLALNSPKPLRFRLPVSEFPRPYVKSSLSQSFSLDS